MVYIQIFILWQYIIEVHKIAFIKIEAAAFLNS